MLLVTFDIGTGNLADLKFPQEWDETLLKALALAVNFPSPFLAKAVEIKRCRRSERQRHLPALRQVQSTFPRFVPDLGDEFFRRGSGDAI